MTNLIMFVSVILVGLTSADLTTSSSTTSTLGPMVGQRDGFNLLDYQTGAEAPPHAPVDVEDSQQVDASVDEREQDLETAGSAYSGYYRPVYGGYYPGGFAGYRPSYFVSYRPGYPGYGVGYWGAGYGGGFPRRPYYTG